MTKVQTKTRFFHLSSFHSLTTEDKHNFVITKSQIKFEQGISPCKAEFPEIKIKRQIVDHYIKGICNLTQQCGTYIIELSKTRNFHGKYVIQTDEVDKEFSKVFTEYIKNIQHQNSQRANSIFTNDVFAII